MLEPANGESLVLQRITITRFLDNDADQCNSVDIQDDSPGDGVDYGLLLGMLEVAKIDIMRRMFPEVYDR